MGPERRLRRVVGGGKPLPPRGADSRAAGSNFGLAYGKYPETLRDSLSGVSRTTFASKILNIHFGAFSEICKFSIPPRTSPPKICKISQKKQNAGFANFANLIPNT